MRKLLIIILSLSVFNSCKDNVQPEEIQVSRQTINLQLKDRLEKILVLDQGVRRLFQKDLSDWERNEIIKEMGLTESSLDKGEFSLMHQIDSANLVEVEKIIEEFGYPGIDLVGTPANEAVFYVIQHSNKIDKYLPLIKKAAQNGDITKKKLALMEDRHLMRNGNEQIYGTQIRGEKKNGEWTHFVWPIKDPDSVNVLRKSIGLESIEEYARKFDIEYKVVTLEEVRQLQ